MITANGVEVLTKEQWAARRGFRVLSGKPCLTKLNPRRQCSDYEGWPFACKHAREVIGTGYQSLADHVVFLSDITTSARRVILCEPYRDPDSLTPRIRADLDRLAAHHGAVWGMSPVAGTGPWAAGVDVMDWPRTGLYVLAFARDEDLLVRVLKPHA